MSHARLCDHAAPRIEDGDLCESACLVWADRTGSQAALVSRVRRFLLPRHRAPSGDIPRVDAPLVSHRKVRQFLLVPGALSPVLQPQTPTSSHMAVTAPAGGRSLLTLSRTACWPRIIQARVTSGLSCLGECGGEEWMLTFPDALFGRVIRTS